MNDLIDLSRLEGEDESPLSGEVTDLASIVTTSFAALSPLTARKGLELNLDIRLEEGASCPVRLSATDATVIVDNLIENAIAYTESGGVHVSLGVFNNHATLKVADTGVGIPAAERERVFERFYRADKARSRSEGGTGLGLSLVKHAVNQGGGRIILDSVVGEGSTFTVRLPLATDRSH